MPRPKPSSHAAILSSVTDASLPNQFTNDYSKYGNHQSIAGGGHGALTGSMDAVLGRTVALKTLHPEHANSDQEQRRLLREARITAQLQHPNTVPVYELGKQADGSIYFAMKKVEGENLFQVIVRIAQGNEETKRQYPLNRLLGVLVQSSNALAYAHSRGVIHRDVKPENILLGPFGEVYLMDWGVAKVWGMAAEFDGDVPLDELYQRLTSTGKRPGTPLYMSPEQTTSGGIVDERSDIFSMGVVLYEILAQREPFRGKTIEETFHNIQTLTPPAPSTIATQMAIPVSLDQICLKALEKKPVDRYQAITEMIQEIRDIREQAISSL